jgi:uncharacterized repeat protein (TIGR01451 family)/fimbrial isopeptide formation D2 family protein
MKMKNGVRPGSPARVGGSRLALAAACLLLAPAVRAGVPVSVPFLTKSFSPGTIGAAGTTTLTFTVTNPAGAPATDVTFTDTLPSGLVVASAPNKGGTCSGAAAATTAAGGTITVTNLSVPAGAATCTVTVDVTNAEGQFNASCGSFPTAFTNTSANVNTTNVQNNVLPGCVAVLVPTLSKTFLPTTVNDGETTVLTFTLANPAGSPASSIVGFTDTLPSGLAVADTTVGGTCANAAAATNVTAGGGTVAVSFLQVPAGAASCTVTVNVTNKTGQANANCNLNPAAFTNFAANLVAVNTVVSSEPACLVVNSSAVPPPAAEVPAASTLSLVLLGGALGAAGVFLARRRSR